MKKIDQFSLEEVGEEWLRELYKVVTMKRSGMFRMITESVRQLLLGNAGGTALVIGFMSSTAVTKSTTYHWIALTALIFFAFGTLASALTMILVAVVSIREAHGTEKALKQFVEGNIHRTDVMFVLEEQTLRIGNAATASGVVSILGFIFGGLISIVLITLFF